MAKELQPVSRQQLRGTRDAGGGSMQVQGPGREVRFDVNAGSGQIIQTRANAGQMQATPVKGGVKTYQDQTSAGFSGFLPAFLEKAMEPYIKSKQSEMMFKGMIDQSKAMAEGEVIVTDNPIGRIFGATGYEQGAAYFRAVRAKEGAAKAIIDRTDEFKKMPSEQAAGEVAKVFEGVLTGDAVVDGLIQSQMFEAMGPTLNSIGKARMAWEQTEAVKAVSGARNSGGANLQAVYGEQMKSWKPGDPPPPALQQATQNYLGLMSKPDGMLEESDTASLLDHATTALREGQFVAYELLRKTGLEQRVGSDAFNKLEERYKKHTSDVYSQWRIRNMGDILSLETAARLGQLDAVTVAGRFMELNARAQRETGILDVPMYDADAIQAGAIRSVDMIISIAKTNEDRAYARSEKIADREAEAEGRLHAADVAAETGMPNDVRLRNPDLTEADLELRYTKAYQANDTGTLVRAVENNNYAAPKLADSIQATVGASIGEGYTESMAKSYDFWSRLNGESPAAAEAYYGKDYHRKMLAMTSMLRTVSAPVAFNATFGNPSFNPEYQLSPDQRRNAKATLTPIIKDAWDGGLVKTRLNASSERLVMQFLETEVAVATKLDPSIPMDKAAKGSLKAAMTQGVVEVHGKFAWRNPRGARSLASVVGVQEWAMDDAFMSLADKRLKARGFKHGAHGEDYMIVREPDRVADGKPSTGIYVVAIGDDGQYHQVRMTSQELRAEADERAKNGMANRERANANKGIWTTPEPKLDKHGKPSIW